MKPLALAPLLAIAACSLEGADYTSVGVTVRFSTALAPDQLRITGRSPHDPEAFIPVFLPEEPGTPLTAGKVSLVILLPDYLEGENVAFRVDGLKEGKIVASGGDEVLIRRNALAGARVFLGAPADCGDGIVRPLLEQCDDGNIDDDDGCDATCTIEAGYVCHTTAPDGPSLCSPQPPRP